jgi:hypothetical protein
MGLGKKMANLVSGEVISALVFDNSLAASVLVLTATLVVVSLFIFKFYKSLSKMNLLSLNLYKYNTSEHPIFNKVWAMLLYLLEYILVIPFLIMLWFAGLAIVLLGIAKDGQGVDYVLLIAAALIGAIRILAYVNTEISAELAKLFPFITLSFFLLTPGDFGPGIISENLEEIPSLLGQVYSFILVVLIIEIILRVFYTLYEFWVSESDVLHGKE